MRQVIRPSILWLLEQLEFFFAVYSALYVPPTGDLPVGGTTCYLVFPPITVFILEDGRAHMCYVLFSSSNRWHLVLSWGIPLVSGDSKMFTNLVLVFDTDLWGDSFYWELNELRCCTGRWCISHTKQEGRPQTDKGWCAMLERREESHLHHRSCNTWWKRADSDLRFAHLLIWLCMRRMRNSYVQ